MSIIINSVSKTFNKVIALSKINLEIKEGKLVALLGPSGSGKTTLLRLIAGLEVPDKGQILNAKEEDLSNLAPNLRDIGFVFQNYALFKHMNVFDNIAFGLRVKSRKVRLSKKKIEEKVESLLALINLKNIKDRYPHTLSGGQKQRVAIARAIASDPKILLLDEPFGALDAKVRKDLRRVLRELHDRLGLTTVFVTHDQEEAMEIADEVVIMSEGKIEQIGGTYELYHHPVNSFVYDFLGNFNVFLGVKDKNNQITIIEYESPDKVTKKSGWFRKGVFNSSIFKVFKGKKYNKNDREKEENFVQIFARPYHMEVLKEPLKDKEYIPVKLNHINYAGPLIKLELQKVDNGILYAEITSKHFESINAKKGDKLFVRATEFTVFE